MKSIKLFLVAMIATIAIVATSCSKSDDSDSSSSNAPDSIGETEWIASQYGDELYIYFSKSTTQCYIGQPGENLLGSYTYSKPNATMVFPNSECNGNTDLLFKCNTNIIGKVNGNKLTVNVNGQNIVFTKVVD